MLYRGDSEKGESAFLLRESNVLIIICGRPAIVKVNHKPKPKREKWLNLKRKF